MTTAVDLPSGRPAGGGQLTAIEQSRAIAEVQAAVVMARQFPRDIATATAEMEQVCRMPALAGRAFFAFPRAGSQITGPTVHLMRELARIWGNVTYGVHELSRDDRKGESEMQAYAWDLQTNSRPVLGFQVPHKRDRERGSGGPQELTQMRDIYENNANNGARRLRECIEAVLPVWFVERAKELCRETNEKGNGKDLPVRIADMLDVFGRQFGITEPDIARKLGRPRAAWTGQDIAALEVVFVSMRRGEVSREDAFPPEPAPPVAVATLGPAPAAQPPATDNAPTEPASDFEREPDAPTAVGARRQARSISKPQQSKLHATLGDLKLGGDAKRDDRLAALSAMVDRPLASSSDLSADEAKVVLDTLEGITNQAADEQQLVVAEFVSRGRELVAGDST